MKPLVISKAGPNIRFLWIENPRMRAYAGIRGALHLPVLVEWSVTMYSLTW